MPPCVSVDGAPCPRIEPAVPTPITSRRHPLVIAYREARKGSDDSLLLLDGWHLLMEAHAAGLAVDVVALGALPPGQDEGEVIERLEQDGTQIVEVTADVLQTISPVRTPSGVVALARRPPPFAGMVAVATPLLLVAVDVQDPGNVGALVRTAEAAGATAVIAAGVSADPLGWKALRASMGSAFRLPIGRSADANSALEDARRAGLRVVALVPRGGADPADVDLTGPLCLVVGGEGTGLSPAIAASADAALSLPMQRPVDSLNVAVAAALALYAAAGQRSPRA